jgi:UDP-glucose 4-epimerase
MIFFSTCATHGVPIRTPINESHPQAPINPNGWSKLCVERMLTHFAAAHPFCYVALHYFNAAGADQAVTSCPHVRPSPCVPLVDKGAKFL